jgi:hypothetical protein
MKLSEKTLDTPTEWRYDVHDSKKIQVIRVQPFKRGQIYIQFFNAKPGAWTCEGRKYCKPEDEIETIMKYFK